MSTRGPECLAQCRSAADDVHLNQERFAQERDHGLSCHRRPDRWRAAARTTQAGQAFRRDSRGKGLNYGVKLFIFDEPTVALDVGAKAEIHWLLASLFAKGAGVIMVSSYLPGVYDLADTLHVFRAGGLVASQGHKDATQEIILTEAIGV